MQTLLTILLAILIFGIMVFVHELGHFISAKSCKVKVNEFAIGMGPTLFRFHKKETTYALRLLPIGGFVQMEGEEEASDQEGSFSSKPIWQRIIIVCAGAIMNLILGFVVLLVVVCIEQNIASTTIASFNQAAVSNKEGGLQVGDKILTINGNTVHIGNDIVYSLVRDKDGIVDFRVKRDGETLEISDVQLNMTEQDGQNTVILDFKVYPLEKNFGTVLREAFFWSCSVGGLVWGSLVDLVTGNFALNQLSGPVGVVTVIGQAASIGIQPLLMLVAFITINLGVFNLLPVPALDGGRLLFLLIEAIRRKPLNPKYEGYVNMAGFALLMLLMIIVTFQDITRLFS